MSINLRPLYLIYILFFSSRLSTGAINVIYLLDAGVTLSLIAFLNAVFSATSLLFSYFCTKAVKLSNRNIICLSLLFYGIYAFCMGLAPNRPALVVAQITYGVALAGMSSSYFSWASQIFSLSQSSQEERIYNNNYFKHTVMRISSFATAFTSTVLPFLFIFYNINFKFMFFMNAIVGIVLLGFYLNYSLQFKQCHTNQEQQNESSKHSNIKLTHLLIQDHALLAVFFISFLFMLVMTPVYALWQPYFKALLHVENKELLYYLLVANCLVFLSQYVFNHVPKKLYKSNFLIMSIFAFLASISLLTTSLLNGNKMVIIACYVIFQGLTSVALYSKNNYILALYEEQSRSLIAKTDMVMRLSSILYSVAIGLTITYITIGQLFVLSAGFLMLISLVATICYRNERVSKIKLQN